MALYENSASKMKVPSGGSQERSIRDGVHQRSAISSLLFIVVMQKAMKEVRRKELKELLSADDLMLMAESEEEAAKFSSWNKGMERIGLRVNMKKTNVMIRGEVLMIRIQSGRHQCEYCGGVGVQKM